MAKSAEPNSNSSTCAGFHRLASSNDKDRVEINDGRKAEREIGAWNLRAIGSPKLRVGTDCVVV